MKAARLYFAVQNSVGHAKSFLQNLKTICVGGLQWFATPAAKYETNVLVDGTGGVGGDGGSCCCDNDDYDI